MKDFVQCWNSLAQRTTTTVDDIPVIIANSLGLDASSILEMKNQEERMRAILWSLPGIPLSLLFNESKERVRPSEHHVDRWMPLLPDRHTLMDTPGLQIKEGTLSLSSSDTVESWRPKVFLLDTPLQIDGAPSEALISVVSDTRVEWFRVVLHRQLNDQFDSSRFHSTAFILEPAGPGNTLASMTQIRSACLHVDALFHRRLDPDPVETEGASCCPGPSGVEFQLLTTFDCPTTIHPLNSNTIPPENVHLARYSSIAPENYTIAVQHGVSSTVRPLPQRPPN
ncbi:hypothetical protein B0T14DRAFT_566341 [Immersiella caudata]|uniref:Uncharacterized protein n=1 Tax=Immersiella caudata TaxID=314043 RepID=A0AA39WQ86_9PEZI|nr:hypothetical protein B0T14DRAFT_566341 [Immersiella caudata]